MTNGWEHPVDMSKGDSMVVLVTGGAGYIGSHTVRALCDCGEEVVVLDTMELGYHEAIHGVPLVEASVADEDIVVDTLRKYKVDAVIHFAAYKAAGESMDYPEKYFENNVCATVDLIHAMNVVGIRQFVYSSSCSVYGTPTALPITEESAMHPESPYAESKCIVEQMLEWLDTCRGLRSARLRYFNAAGASLDGSIGESPRLAANLIPVAMQAALGNRPVLKLFGTDYGTPDGTAVRDYVHVLDLAEAHVKALEYVREHDASMVLNLGTGKGYSVKEVVETVIRVTGREIPIEWLGRRPGDPEAIWADSSRARSLMGWVPRYNLEDMIQTAWNWHLARPDGY